MLETVRKMRTPWMRISENEIKRPTQGTTALEQLANIYARSSRMMRVAERYERRYRRGFLRLAWR